MVQNTEKEKRHQLKVIVNLILDSEKLDFPIDDNGIFIWDPITCINDYISHGLFKGHDASYMDYLDPSECIQFKDWDIKYPSKLKKELMKIYIMNIWEHPESKSGKKLHKDFESLEQALNTITKNFE